MPKDLFEDNQPVDLFEKMGINPSIKANSIEKNKTNSSLLPRIGADVLAGLAQMGHGLINAPHNLTNLVSPSLANKVPALPDYDYGEMLGVQNPNLGDKLLQGAAQYAPALLGGEALLANRMAAYGLSKAPLSMRLGSQGLTGMAFGATQDTNPIQGATLGGIANAGGELLGSGVNALVKSGKNALSQFVPQGLFKNVADSLKNAKQTSNAQAFDMAKVNYSDYVNAENKAWDVLLDEAKNVKLSNNNKFNNDKYKQSLIDKLNELKGQSARQSGFSRSNKDAESLLNDYVNDTHDSYINAIEHNKSLNKDYQNEITPGKSLPFNIVNYAKRNLKNTIDENIKSHSLEDTLGKSFNNANKKTALKNEIFNEIINTGGNKQYSSFSKFLKEGNKSADPSTFVYDYLPKGRGDGIQKMQQFAKLIGDENYAKDTLKLNYFDLDKDLNPKSFLTKYDNLSKEQQNYLFNAEQRTSIKAIENILKDHPNALNQKTLNSYLSSSLPTIIGAIGGHAIGVPYSEGAIAGYIGGKGLSGLLNKASEEPEIANYLAKMYSSPNKSKSSLNQSLIPSLVTPEVLKRKKGNGLAN